MVNKDRLERRAPQDRRKDILNVARQVFAEEGYGGASMSRIAARLGGSKGTLYAYFQTKAALFEAVTLQCCEDLSAGFDQVLKDHQDVRDYLTDLGVRLLSAMLEPNALDISRWVISEGSRHPEIARIYAENALDPSVVAVARGLSHFHGIGQLNCPESTAAAGYFLGLIRADLHLRVLCGVQARPSATSIYAQVVRAVSLFTASLSPRAPKQLVRARTNTKSSPRR